MEWFRASSNYADSDQGYRVLFIRRGDGWLYLAYGPQQSVTWDMMKAHYKIGEKVPVGREYIGGYHDPDQAKQACDEHWGKINECDDAATG